MTGLCPAPVCPQIDCSTHVDMLKNNTHTHTHLKIRLLWCHKEACYLSKLSDLVLPSVLAGSLSSMCLWEAVNIGLTKYSFLQVYTHNLSVHRVHSELFKQLIQQIIWQITGLDKKKVHLIYTCILFYFIFKKGKKGNWTSQHNALATSIWHFKHCELWQCQHIQAERVLPHRKPSLNYSVLLSMV